MKATIITTNLQKNLRWASASLEAGQADCMHQLSVYPRNRHQLFHGFGGAFTEAAAYCYQQLPEEKRQEFMEAYFGKEGLRYTVGRTHLNSCDFSLGNYACMEGPEDLGFYTGRDEQYLIPMILDAQEIAGKPISLLVSPWSPPAFMKTNGDMNHGGKLKEEYRELWAACLAKYVAFYRSKGCHISMISIQNEPAATQIWDSCIYSGAEEGAFAPILRNALDAAGCGDVQILAWDHNKDVFVYRAEDTLSVTGAQEALAGFGIPDLQLGDEVIITNLWETLTYRVAETKIIAPNEVNEILLQEGKDKITLLTCHPYASGGKQRYLVICDRYS